MSPFVSQAQRKKFYATPSLRQYIPEFEAATPKKLPKHVNRSTKKPPMYHTVKKTGKKPTVKKKKKKKGSTNLPASNMAALEGNATNFARQKYLSGKALAGFQGK